MAEVHPRMETALDMRRSLRASSSSVKAWDPKMNFCECGCGQQAKSRFIRGHSSRTAEWKEHMRLDKPAYRGARTPIGGNGHLRIADGIGGTKLEHVAIAEHLLGRPLPHGAQVHHVNEIKSDNRNCNLVICPSQAYHSLLHVRARALDACGNVNWRKCYICGQYDDPENLYVKPNKAAYRHRQCHAKVEAKRGKNI